MAALEGQVGIVTGGGRGIGATVAAELAGAGMRVAVTGRTREQVERVAAGVGGIALVGDVSSPADVERWIATTRRELGPIDLLVNNAAVTGAAEPFWESDADDWWRIFEINVRGPQLCCRAVLSEMVARGRGRIVNLVSGAAYLPSLPANVSDTSYPPSKAALMRFTEVLADQVRASGVRVFAVAPGLVQTGMTAGLSSATHWTPPDAAPRFIRALAEGRADALAGRYLHAEHDADIDALAARAAEVDRDDLNAIRLRR